jgi:cell division protein FtsX
MTARVRLLVSEAWSSITANISTTFAAVITVLISMFLLGLLLALGTWLISYSDHVKKGVLVKVYFAGSTSDRDEYAVGQRLKRDPRVDPGGVVYVSKERAFEQEKKKYPELYANVPSNPLPDSYQVKLKKAEDAPILGREIQKAVNAHSSAWTGVDDVKWGEETTKRVLTVAKWVSIVFLVAIVLLVIASTLLIANTIRSCSRACSRGSSARCSRSSSSCSARRSRCRRSCRTCTAARTSIRSRSP